MKRKLLPFITADLCCPAASVKRFIICCLICLTTVSGLIAQSRRAARVGISQPPAVRVTLNDLINVTAARNELPPALLAELVHTESGGRYSIVSPKGAGGLTQLMPGTARRFGVRNVFDPIQNLEGGARYLRYLLTLFGGDVRLALAAYNSGEATVIAYRDGYSLRLSDGKIINPRGLRTGGIPPYRETQNYVAKIYGSTYNASSVDSKRRINSLSSNPTVTPDTSIGITTVVAARPSLVSVTPAVLAPVVVQTSSTYFWK